MLIIYLLSTHLFITHLFITHLFITHLFITHLFITYLLITYLFIIYLIITYLLIIYLSHFFFCFRMKCDVDNQCDKSQIIKRLVETYSRLVEILKIVCEKSEINSISHFACEKGNHFFQFSIPHVKREEILFSFPFPTTTLLPLMRKVKLKKKSSLPSCKKKNRKKFLSFPHVGREEKSQHSSLPMWEVGSHIPTTLMNNNNFELKYKIDNNLE